MKEVLDVLIPLAFVVFMVFVFGGYHASKRKQEEEREEKKNSESLKD